jgi:hypothetical protein
LWEPGPEGGGRLGSCGAQRSLLLTQETRPQAEAKQEGEGWGLATGFLSLLAAPPGKALSMPRLPKEHVTLAE